MTLNILSIDNDGFGSTPQWIHGSGGLFIYCYVSGLLMDWLRMSSLGQSLSNLGMMDGFIWISSVSFCVITSIPVSQLCAFILCPKTEWTLEIIEPNRGLTDVIIMYKQEHRIIYISRFFKHAAPDEHRLSASDVFLSKISVTNLTIAYRLTKRP